MALSRSCAQCGTAFEIADEDLAFYDKVSPVFQGKKIPIPPPVRCPDCRHALRMAFRNERHLYRRTCDRCSAKILSIYPAQTPFPVYCYDCWWSDTWSALEYGREMDFSKPFFGQFEELLHVVPRLGIVGAQNENCDYCNYVNYSKDTYLCFGCHNVERCFHCWRTHWSASCIDCLQLDKGTLCYELVDCDGCYNVLYSQNCTGCSDSVFLFDCRGCKDCIGCIGMHKGQYRIFNEQYSKSDFEKKKESMRLYTAGGIERMRREFADFSMKKPHRHAFLVNGENVHGDHIINSRNLYECYHVKDAEDCRYLESCEAIKDSMDNTFSGWPAELVFETISAGVHCYRQLFSSTSWSCTNLLFCDSCHHSADLFGCIALRSKNQYCILNKQYTKEDYEQLVVRILEHMQATNEFGSFFPPHLSPHGYNETIAMEFYPLAKEEAIRRGYRWTELHDEIPEAKKIIPAASLPETIEETPDDILQWAIQCASTGRLFRIVRQELDFYRQMRLPIPHFHPNERHRRRMALRNPRKLWRRACMKCGKEIESSYAPERPAVRGSEEPSPRARASEPRAGSRGEIVYCEECYLASVY